MNRLILIDGTTRHKHSIGGYAASAGSTRYDWLNQNETTSLFLSIITIAEVGYGLELLPESEKKTDLEGRFRRFLN